MVDAWSRSGSGELGEVFGPPECSDRPYPAGYPYDCIAMHVARGDARWGCFPGNRPPSLAARAFRKWIGGACQGVVPVEGREAWNVAAVGEPVLIWRGVDLDPCRTVVCAGCFRGNRFCRLVLRAVLSDMGLGAGGLGAVFHNWEGRAADGRCRMAAGWSDGRWICLRIRDEGRARSSLRHS
jgi:hypothetical protein